LDVTALISAAMHGHEEVVRELIIAKADPFLKSNQVG